jgi:hypothetical protein
VPGSELGYSEALIQLCHQADQPSGKVLRMQPWDNLKTWQRLDCGPIRKGGFQLGHVARFGISKLKRVQLVGRVRVLAHTYKNAEPGSSPICALSGHAGCGWSPQRSPAAWERRGGDGQ